MSKRESERVRESERKTERERERERQKVIEREREICFEIGPDTASDLALSSISYIS